MAHMVTLTKADTHFVYRVAGVAVTEDAVLLHRAETDGFWTLPGGRVHVLESAEEALRREIHEEIGVQPTVGRLLWIGENFFQYNGVRCHELGLYFSMRFAPDSRAYNRTEPFHGEEDVEVAPNRKLKLIFQWFPREKRVLESLTVYPAFLQKTLIELPAQPQHVVHYDAGFPRTDNR